MSELAHKFQFALQPQAGQVTPPLAAIEDYAESREIAGQKMMLRLVYSAMQEGIFPPGSSLTVQQDGEEQQLSSARQVYDHLYTRDDTLPESLTLHLPDGDHELNAVDTFLNGPLREHVIAQVSEASVNANWLQFQYEITDSLNHEALAVSAKRHFAQSLEAETTGQDNLFQWLASDKGQEWMAEHHHDTDSFLLQMGAFGGHPTHPSSKMRLKLSPQDKTRRTAIDADEAQSIFPEFAPDVPLALYAVKAGRATTKTSDRDFPQGYRAYMQEAFPDAFSRWEEALEEKLGKDKAQNYLPIPVHPLQKAELAERFAAQIAADDIVPLPGVTVTQRPTISTRTLTPVDKPDEPQIKTTINMQMTSVVRTIAPARAYNSPVYSDVVGDIVRRDDSIRPHIRPLMEQATAYWGTDTDSKSQDYADGYQLCAVFKQNPAQLVQQDEIRMPVATMLHKSPFSGKPVLVDIMRSAGIETAEQARDFLRDYADIVIKSEVGLLARYGVGLEGHQQNNDMVFDAASARPKASVYRDINGGIEASEPVLQMNGYDMAKDMHPVKKGLYDDIDLPLQQTMHTTFHSHLFPLTAIIAKEYDMPQRELYSEIRASVEDTLASARHDHMPAMLNKLPQEARGQAQEVFERSLDTIADNLLSREMETKCLLSMRLAQSQDMRFSRSANPLAAVGR